MITDRHIATIESLFTGTELGGYTLPPELIALRKAYGTIATYTVPTPDDPGAAYQQAIRDVMDAAKSGAPNPVDLIATVEEAERAARRAERAATLIATGREQLAGELRDATRDLAPTILVEHLQPAFAGIIEAATKDAKKLAGVGATPDARTLLAADRATSAAWLAMDGHALKYLAVHGARGVLARLGLRPQLDEANLFGELSRPQDLYDVKLFRHSATRPWPDEAKARFMWLAINAAGRLWLPTVEQQDRAWSDLFGEDLERAQRGLHQLAGWRSLGGW